MRTILKILIILASISALFISSWALVDVNKAYGDKVTIIDTLFKIIGSPTPIVFGLGVYFSLQSTYALLAAIFNKRDTKTLQKNYLIKSSILLVIGFVLVLIDSKLFIGFNDGKYLLAGCFLLFTYMIGFFLLEISYRKRKEIWHFLVHK